VALLPVFMLMAKTGYLLPKSTTGKNILIITLIAIRLLQSFGEMKDIRRLKVYL